MEINGRKLVKYNILKLSLIDIKIENLYIFFFFMFFILMLFLFFLFESFFFLIPLQTNNWISIMLYNIFNNVLMQLKKII
jgi:hypothetical protein